MKFSWSKNQPHICSAPMHGITNSAQRQIFKKFGAKIVFSEMVSSMGLHYENKKTIRKTLFSSKEKPIIIQIFGNSTDEIINATKLAEKYGADGIDFNCGCPARNMIASGNGGVLLLEPDKLIQILSSIKKNTKLPVSLKTRIGYDKILPVNFYKKIISGSKIDCLIIHGRTVKQKYQGKSDWDHIKKIYNNLNIPVIGSGDITRPELALDRLKNYTPSGIMIGRGSLGNPWIFEKINRLLQEKKIRNRFSINKIISTIKLHSKLLIKETQAEEYAIIQMRKHFGWYIKDIPHAKKYRTKLFHCQNSAECTKILDEIKDFYAKRNNS